MTHTIINNIKLKTDSAICKDNAKENDFCLSDKIEFVAMPKMFNEHQGVYLEEDVKEFIRLLKEECECKRINRLAGDKLI